jgi:hypothetical protein
MADPFFAGVADIGAAAVGAADVGVAEPNPSGTVPVQALGLIHKSRNMATVAVRKAAGVFMICSYHLSNARASGVCKEINPFFPRGF